MLLLSKPMFGNLFVESSGVGALCSPCPLCPPIPAIGMFTIVGAPSAKNAIFSSTFSNDLLYNVSNIIYHDIRIPNLSEISIENTWPW